MTNMEKIRLCGEIVDQIQKESRRPLCRLEYAPEPFAFTGSHLGGTPYLPHDASYPMGADGQPLWLCAQIDFSKMPPLPDFPTQGLLQIYLSDWRYDGGFGLCSGDGLTQDQWRICYWPEIDGTVTEADCRAKMPIPWEEASIENMGRPLNQLDKQSIQYAKKYGKKFPGAKDLSLWRTPDEPLALTFLPAEAEGVSYTDFRFEKAFAAALAARLPDADPEDLMPYELEGETPAEREALRAIYGKIALGGCKIGGYPEFAQDDPRAYGEDRTAWEILLLQLSDDGGADLQLNGGTLNFLIRPQDLRARDFSQVLAQWACT